MAINRARILTRNKEMYSLSELQGFSFIFLGLRLEPLCVYFTFLNFYCYVTSAPLNEYGAQFLSMDYLWSAV